MENFKIPHLDKVVGVPNRSHPKADIQKAQKILEEFLVSQFKEGGKKIKKYEIEKTEKDIELINFVQNAVDDYLEKYKRNKKVSIPLENIHVLIEGGTRKFTKDFEMGSHSNKYGSVLIDRSARDIDFSLTLFHELLHAKSFTAMQITQEDKKGKRSIEPYRSGFSVNGRDGKTIYFTAVNEAIVGLLTKRFLKEYIEKDEIFKDEIKDMKEKNILIDTSREDEVTAGLKYIDEVYQLNKDNYSLQEITDIFIDAGINGNLLKIARLVEGTFGKGNFRKLGQRMGKD